MSRVAVDEDRLDRVRRRLARPTVHGGVVTPTPAQVAQALRAEGVLLGDTAMLELVTALRGELVGTGRLETLLADPDVTDVVVNGPTQVWVDRGSGLVRTDIAFDDDADVRRLAQRLAAGAGRRLDDAVPFADVVLADGTRVHAVLPPVSPGGTQLALRVPRRRAFGLEELVERGALPAAGTPWLVALMQARLAGLVSGGTATGKTTWLSMLLGLVAPSERLVLVEDVAELVPRHPHVVRLVGRPPNVEGAGAVALRELVRQALRMRPDRLVVGEARGPEVSDLLAAFNTGHEGGWATVHANSAGDVVPRLEALAATAGMDRPTTHAQVRAALDVVVHLRRRRDGVRSLDAVHVVDRIGSVLGTAPALVVREGEVVAGPGLPALRYLLTERAVAPPSTP